LREVIPQVGIKSAVITQTVEVNERGTMRASREPRLIVERDPVHPWKAALLVPSGRIDWLAHVPNC
jgi:hypothetical protein